FPEECCLLQRRAFERGRRIAVKLAKCGAKVTVTAKAEIQSQSRQVVAARKEVQGTRQTEPQLVLIQRQSLYLLENLSEIDRRNAQFGGDLGQSPASRQIARQHQFGSIYQFLATNRRARRVRTPRPESLSQQSQCQDLSFQGFHNLSV